MLDLTDAPAIYGLRFRRPRSDDAEYAAMAALIERASVADGIPWLPTPEHLREEMEASDGLVPAEDAVLTYVGETLVAESGVERVVRDGTPTYEFWGRIHPDWRRRGLGTCLLRENLRRAAERIPLEPVGQPVVMAGYAMLGVDGASPTGALDLYEGLGFAVHTRSMAYRRPIER